MVILRDSGSDTARLREMIGNLNAEWANTDTRIHGIPGYRVNGFDKWLLEQGESEADIGLHAGILDTSLLLAINPGHVRQDKLADRSAFEGSVNGNPARATRAYGVKGLQLMIDTSVESIRELRVSSRQKR